jgi:cell division septum initiation protein DivIVA
MSKVKQLSQKQLEVIEDLFEEGLDEEAVLKKRKVRRRTYRRWHTMSNFTAEYKRRLKQAKLECERIMAKYSNMAASKLVELTQSKKEEIARKASLDVINYFRRKTKGRSVSKNEPEAEKLPDLPPEVASRLLAALANDGKQKPAQQ